MTPRILRRGISCGLLLAGAACTSPRAHWFVLDAGGAQSADYTSSRAILLVKTVNIPAEIDRPQVVVRDGPDRITISEQERWAAPLKESLPNFIATQLSRHSSGTRFATNLGALLPASTASLDIDVVRFDVSRETGAAVVLRWIYRSPGLEPSILCGESAGEARVEKKGYEGLVEALRQAVEQAAAHLVKQLPDG